MTAPCSRRRLPRVILEALDGTDWDLVPGKKHIKITIGGKLVTVISHGHRPGYDRAELGIAITIKKFRERG